MSVEAEGCNDCPLERRAFLRDAAMAIAGVMAAIGIPRSVAEALPVRAVRAVRVHGDERAYPIPAADGVEIDRDESLIVARAQGMAFVFSLACPHQNTALRWNGGAHQFQCPKHKSKYTAEGVFIEGRATRSMDRFAVRRDGNQIVADLDRLYRQDEDAEAWKSAFVKLIDV